MDLFYAEVRVTEVEKIPRNSGTWCTEIPHISNSRIRIRIVFSLLMRTGICNIYSMQCMYMCMYIYIAHVLSMYMTIKIAVNMGMTQT